MILKNSALVKTKLLDILKKRHFWGLTGCCTACAKCACL